MKLIYTVSFLLFFIAGNRAQEMVADSMVAIKKVSKHSPRKASVLSAALPGAGQVYNRKAWKVPIFYAGLGGFGYLFYSQQTQYSFYQKSLRAETDDDPNTINTSGYGVFELQSLKLQHRKFRDIGAFGFIAVYLINIIDANVDAHLKTFDVSDDLSMKINPLPLLCLNTNGFGFAPGVSIKLQFKK